MNEPHTHVDASTAPNSRKVLDCLLDAMLQHPEQNAHLTAQIHKTFGQKQAALIIDMCGFTRTTHEHGIVAFLLMIHQMHLVCCPVIQEHSGKLIKTEADNLFCLFATVEDALAASLEMIQRLETVNLLLPEDRHLYASIGIGYGLILNIEDRDLFGDEINLACKLSEDIATKNSILFTERAHDEIGPRPDTVAKAVSVSGLTLPYFELVR